MQAHAHKSPTRARKGGGRGMTLSPARSSLDRRKSLGRLHSGNLQRGCELPYQPGQHTCLAHHAAYSHNYVPVPTRDQLVSLMCSNEAASAK